MPNAHERFFSDGKFRKILYNSDYMTLNEVRAKYIEFFKNRPGFPHVEIPSASLVPENDPTTLFTGSGMQPLVSYLLGQKHPAGERLVNSQKCFRSEDIEEVGDNRHTTFFEMLGNWSLGDYWKKEQLSWLFEFLTKEIGIDKERLSVTCFEGDEKLNLPRDTESSEIWEKLGIPKERIYFYPARKNWWSRSGAPEKMPAGEPGGPDSEVFYEFTQIEHDKKFGEKCHPNCDCGRFMEIGNSVFMEYRKTETRSTGSGQAGFEKLAQRNVDFGGGLERITAAANDNPDILKGSVFEAEALAVIRATTSVLSRDLRNLRIIADHLRATVFLISDGVLPSNTERGYFLRRLIRRAISVAQGRKIEEPTIRVVVEMCAFVYKNAYPEIESKKEKIVRIIFEEAEQFGKALQRGLHEFEKLATTNISGKVAFLLFSSYGMPVDMIVDLALIRNLKVDMEGFKIEFEKHKELSSAGADKKFKGGLADTSEMSLKYHTATHLLHQALRDVYGTHVGQKGSNITKERLRFDFTHPIKMTAEEIKKVEVIVNDKILAKLPVNVVTLPRAEAEKTGALHFFGEKYGDMVTVHYIGDSLPTAYSKEFCGGPHVKNTGELGVFKITKEEAVSAGVRRIKAVLA